VKIKKSHLIGVTTLIGGALQAFDVVNVTDAGTVNDTL